MSAIDDGFFTHSRNVLNDSIMDFMHSTSDALITTLQPVLITALTIYFMCKAWSIMYGTGEGSMKQLTMQVIKMAFVTSMFCSTAYFYTNIAEPVYKLDEFFAPAVSANFKFKSENSYDALDKIYSNMLTNASTAVSKSWEEASKPNPIDLNLPMAGSISFSMPDLGLIIKGLLIMFVYAVLIFCTIFAVFIAFLILITNTLGLCFVLAFGPLFGCFLLFPQTKDLFNSWIKQCLTFVLTMVFVMAAINLMGQIIDNTVGLKEAPTSASFAGLAKAFHNTEGVGKLVAERMSDIVDLSIKLTFVSLLILFYGFFVMKCPEIAKGIVGGMSMGGGSAAQKGMDLAGAAGGLVTGGVGGAVGKAIGNAAGKAAVSQEAKGHKWRAGALNWMNREFTPKPKESSGTSKS